MMTQPLSLTPAHHHETDNAAGAGATNYDVRLAQARAAIRRAEKAVGLTPSLTLGAQVARAGADTIGRAAGASGAVVGESFPIPPALSELLPRGLQAGQIVEVAGSTSVLFAMAAHAAGNQRWCAVIGAQSLGWAALADLGLDMARTIVIPPHEHAVKALDIVLECFPICILGPQVTIPGGQRRTLRGKVRHHKTLVLAYHWPQAGTALRVRPCGGQGLRRGAGRLRAVEWEVTLAGAMGTAPRARRAVRVCLDEQGHLRAGSALGVAGGQQGQPALNVITSPRGEGREPIAPSEVAEATFRVGS